MIFWLLETNIDSMFDWRKTEDTINSFPNFKTKLKGENDEEFDIHFLALFSEREDAVPIMLNHGWPGIVSRHLQTSSLIKNLL